MVIESIIKPRNAINNPHKVILYTFSVSILAIILSYNVFYDFSSIASLAFIVIGLLPFINNILKIEEEIDMTLENENEMIKHHRKVITLFLYMFIAITMAYLIFYLIMPTNVVETLFNYQIQTINQVNSPSGSETIVANVISNNPFFIILLNNLRVMLFCIVFSFLYSSGAIFFLSWTASLMAAAIGSFIRSGVSSLLVQFESLSGIHYVQVLSIGVLRYFIHGIFEITAYLFAALAGGIISYAVINHHYQSKKFNEILLDSFDLIILSVIFLILGSLIEVYISPLIGGFI